ncbi:MAG: S41 family peptidase [Bacteroidales bacterium]|nr:S41 family peptidase [Bacteroidales bacterium]
MKNVFLFSLLFYTSIALSFGQQCNCSESFDWMVNTFKTNDAGFQYVIDKKGIDEYTTHTNFYRDKALNTTSNNDCLTVLNNWLFFFRKGHIGAYLKPGLWQNMQSPALSEQSKDSIRTLYSNEEIIDFSEAQFREYLRQKKGNLNAIEGIWNSNTYSIGIMSSPGKKNQFVAFIIRADSIYWLPKQKKIEFTMKKDSSFSMVYSMRDHSKKNDEARLVGNSGNLLLIFNTIWTKVYPETRQTQKDELFLKLRTATSPFIEKLSDRTLYLRIPSFEYAKKPEIDSLLQLHDSLIKTIPNLIIDIRNGTGGSDLSFYKLIPYFYTQPIRSMNLKYYSTELNAQGYDNWANTISDTAVSRYCQRVALKMRQNIGSFIALNDSTVSITKSYIPSACPVKVAIICNQYNGSTDEAFLLKAKQSSKVKVFGRPTAGVLDISNIRIVDFPNGMFQLIYSMTARIGLPVFSIDGVGIQPDYFIDDSIPEEDWINFVMSTIEY